MTATNRLRVLFATGHPHLPQIAGGLQSSTSETMRGLIARGHDARLLCGLTGDGPLGLRHRVTLKLGRRMVAEDHAADIPAYRAWNPCDSSVIYDVLTDFRPDVVVAQGGDAADLIQGFDAHDIPGAIYFRNVEFDDLIPRLPRLSPDTAYISNSGFTRRRARQVLGVDSTVIYPLIDADRYRVESLGRRVVFINPHPSKGVQIALDVARRCPDIPFLFVEAWTLAGPDHDRMRAEVRALPNVDYQPRTADMAAIFRQARLILVPSQWEEAFGRVVAEAQVSGIPAVASDIGGLPEALGDGGILLAADAPAALWAATVRAIWDDPAEHARLAQAALAHAMRPAMNPAHQFDRLETVLADRVARRSGVQRRGGNLPLNGAATAC